MGQLVTGRLRFFCAGMSRKFKNKSSIPKSRGNLVQVGVLVVSQEFREVPRSVYVKVRLTYGVSIVFGP